MIPVPRRRFQFRLRTLMIGVTLLAVPLGYVGSQATIVRDREAFLEGREYLLVSSSPSVEPTRAPWMLRLLGAESVYLVNVYSQPQLHRAAILFPEAIIIVKYDQGRPPRMD